MGLASEVKAFHELPSLETSQKVVPDDSLILHHR